MCDVRVELVADADRFRALLHLLDELVVELVGHQDARARLADLALVQERAEAGALDGQVHVRVVEDDVRRLAAQLQRHLLHRVRSQAHDLAADFGAAGEGDLVDGRVRADGVAQRAARARE